MNTSKLLQLVFSLLLLISTADFLLAIITTSPCM